MPSITIRVGKAELEQFCLTSHFYGMTNWLVSAKVGLQGIFTLIDGVFVCFLLI